MIASGTPLTSFSHVGERLWLDFVNTDEVRQGARLDMLSDFSALVAFLEGVGVLDHDRAALMQRRAHQQPAGATAALLDARRTREALRQLAEAGPASSLDALTEINRVLGRSAGTRRIETRSDGSFVRSFVPVGDAFAGITIPIVESAAESLIAAELDRIRRCGDHRCNRVFLDPTRNGSRRWCSMATCGNRAKAARFRERHQPGTEPLGSTNGE